MPSNLSIVYIYAYKSLCITECRRKFSYGIKNKLTSSTHVSLEAIATHQCRADVKHPEETA